MKLSIGACDTCPVKLSIGACDTCPVKLSIGACDTCPVKLSIGACGSRESCSINTASGAILHNHRNFKALTAVC